ncbi:sulfurtransferase [Salinispira pacifica]|uniref:Sulfurtransferase n=1 Tax=Salinispira pacifica TaxID=1307761 RepID=V5WFD9_9SPIO|nr:sulfurtransferase [Salinispira pacifica]AHC14360.1 Thiosulfate sulfurtransferase, rhodanese [Salinispira pacifica]
MEINKLLIHTDEARRLIREGAILPVDCRGKDQYSRGHIPGAACISVAGLQDPESPAGDLLPEEELIRTIRHAGIDSSRRLLLYDESGLVPSAKLFWILESLGRKNISLLDGGWPAWRQQNLPEETGNENVTNGSAASETEAANPDGLFTRSGENTATAELEDVLNVLNAGDTAIVDARSAGEYSGETVTAEKNGHIPGAVHIEWQEHLEDILTPRFKPKEDLRKLYESRGVTPGQNVIVYCRSGTRSSHSYFTLRYLGYSEVKNYAGSWLEWGNHPDTPVSSAVRSGSD